MKKIKPLTKQRRFRRWLRNLFGRRPRASEIFAAEIGNALDEMHQHRPKRPVVLTYTEEEAAMLFDLLNSEMEELMSLNTANRLSKEPIFEQEQTEYLHKVMDFCAEQMKALSKYANIGG